jgi:GT2 family glycosyltransferase
LSKLQQEKLPKVAVVIVNWNGERFLDRCLSALLAQSENLVLLAATIWQLRQLSWTSGRFSGLTITTIRRLFSQTEFTPILLATLQLWKRFTRASVKF